MRRLMWAIAFISWPCGTALAQQPTPTPGVLVFGCGPSPEEIKATALARLSETVPSPDEREVHLAAARRAIARVADLRRDVLAGKPVEEPYKSVSFFGEILANAPSEELAELYRRYIEDQFARSHFSAVLEKSSWAANLPEATLAYAYYIIGSEACSVDAANVQWLKARLSEHGWYTISKYGSSADLAAWLLVQHADHDPAFQAEVLEMLEPLLIKNETRQRNYAYLYDRVAVNGNRPQRYGTQGRCISGKWEPREVEAPDELDARRAAVGLEPEAVYAAGFTCPPA